jgi:hypothetical protein
MQIGVREYLEYRKEHPVAEAATTPPPPAET